jgi:nicotinamide mononucleotide adenylyltransferase
LPVSSRGTQLLTRVFEPGAPKSPWAPGSGQSTMASALSPTRDAAAKLAAPSRRRTQISELHQSLHCSIIGTCLSSAELRRLLVRLEVQGAEIADDHDLHVMGVLLAGRSKAGAKHLQKTLDRRHQPALNQFAKAKDAAAVATLWEEALGRGDIPGAYWALLTHPAATDDMVKDVFGKVHMLSHLVGAANRADIRRLRQLEEDNATLAAKLERAQRQLREGFTSRDESIRRLNDTLARVVSQDAMVPASEPEDTRALKDALAELDKRLAQETSRRERLEQRLATASGAINEAERTRVRAEGERDALQQELALLENRLGASAAASTADGLDLRGLTVLYVGGRANQAPQLKGLVESTKGHFLYHDGGIEHSAALLPGLVSRADIAVFPVDCVSHDAAAGVKRVCRQLGKRYIPLRTSSLTCLLSGLSALQTAPVSAEAS